MKTGVAPLSIRDFARITSSYFLRDTNRTRIDLPPLRFLFPVNDGDVCTNGFERVHYTFVCDYRPDCSDASDEKFCVFPPCRITEFSCGNQQCLPHEQLCDGVEQCANGADEKVCLNKARGTGMTSADVSFNTMLVHLSLAECGLTHLDMPDLPNLRSLDLSDNLLTSLVGNVGSFVYRAIIDKVSNSHGFGVFVTHLCLADSLMGVYLAVIGVADRLYQGNYLWKDREWKHSTTCKSAGFLSLLSSEVSAFIICLITLDRFLVLRFPFSHFHFERRSAHVACAIVWAVGLVLAAIPLLPVTSHWEFYSQTGICIPLPIARNDFAGHTYSFSVVIVLNFVLFLVIAAGQVFIYWSIRTNSMTASDTTKTSKDLTIARRLITIAVSDFLCWFPIGLLGLLAANGVPVPGEVNVAVAIVVLPINSAFNPFLYTLNMLLERRRRAPGNYGTCGVGRVIIHIIRHVIQREAPPKSHL
nr:hypothetical protein BaRGS_013178 [Batillaria attramentaria]